MREACGSHVSPINYFPARKTGVRQHSATPVRKFCCKVICFKLSSCHTEDSKAIASARTGGSCKKSPDKMTWTPPKGWSWTFRTWLTCSPGRQTKMDTGSSEKKNKPYKIFSWSSNIGKDQPDTKSIRHCISANEIIAELHLGANRLARSRKSLDTMLTSSNSKTCNLLRRSWTCGFRLALSQSSSFARVVRSYVLSWYLTHPKQQSPSWWCPKKCRLGANLWIVFVFDAFLKINHNAPTFPAVLVIFGLGTAQKWMHRAAADANPGHTCCSTNANSLFASLLAEELHHFLQEETLASAGESWAGSSEVIRFLCCVFNRLHIFWPQRRMFQHVSACFTQEKKNNVIYIMPKWPCVCVCIKNERIGIGAKPFQLGSCARSGMDLQHPNPLPLSMKL